MQARLIVSALVSSMSVEAARAKEKYIGEDAKMSAAASPQRVETQCLPTKKTATTPNSPATAEGKRAASSETPIALNAHAAIQ